MRRIKQYLTYGQYFRDRKLTIISKRDYRLMRAVVRAAETVGKHRFHTDRDRKLAIDILLPTLDAFNSSPEKRK